MAKGTLVIDFTDPADFTPGVGDVRSTTFGPVNDNVEARQLVEFTVTLTVDKSVLEAGTDVTATLDV